MINKRMLYFKQNCLISYLFSVVFIIVNCMGLNLGYTTEKDLSTEYVIIKEKIEELENSGVEDEIMVYNRLLGSDFMHDSSFRTKFIEFMDYCVKERESINRREQDSKSVNLQYLANNKFLQPKMAKIVYLNLSLFFQNYLEDKYLDTKGKKLGLNELIIQQQNMYNDITKFVDIAKNTKIINYIYSNTSISENIINFIFAKKYLEENKQFGTTLGIKKSYTINEAKQSMTEIVFTFFDSNDNKQMSISTTKKPYGSQFGLILHEKGKNDTDIGKYFIKTHQNGNRNEGYSSDIYTSKSLAEAEPVNLKELFVYRLLEKIGIGAKVDFLVNPFSKNSLVISTRSIDDFVMGGRLSTKFGLYKNLFDDAENEIDESRNIVWLKSDPNKQISLELLNDLKSKFTGFDLLNRALRLSDINEGNYGLITGNNNKYFIKLVDFIVPKDHKDDGYEIKQDNFLRSFLRANGSIYTNNGFIRSVLGKKTENEKITLAYKNLNIFDNITDEVLYNTYKEIENFAIQNDEISNKQNAEIMGIEYVNPNSVSDNQSIADLQQYYNDIKTNINMIKEIIKTKYNGLLENIRKDTKE